MWIPAMTGVFKGIITCFLILISSYSVKGATQLECGPYQCVGQQVQYQCNVTGSSVLVWRVINDSVILEDLSYTTGSSPSSIADVLTGAPEFSTILSSVSSSPQLIMSSIIFTGQTNINGYNIECDDNGGDKKNCSIVVPGIPSSPDNVTIHTDTFTISSVYISWTESSSPCVTGYRYNISSSALEENIIMESTSNSVMVKGLVPSDNQYYVSVTAIDTGDRTSSGSDPVCFIFNVPQSVQNLAASNTTGSNENTVNIIVTWDAPDDDPTDCEFFPMLTGYTVSITASMTVNNLPGPVSLPPSATMHTFENLPKGVNYTITVIARNGVGSAPSDNVFYVEVPGIFVQPSATSSTISLTSPSSGIKSTSASTTSSTPAHSPSFSTSISSISRSATSTTLTTESDPGPPYIPIIVPVVIILILIIIVIILVIVYCVYRNRDRGSASDPIPLKEKHTTRAHQPETGQPTYENPNDAVQHKAAPTGDLYAEPQVKSGSSGRRPPPQPTYQDPDTIQRQQGPTGDMYAMPDRKKPGPGEVYADLDLSTNSPRSPQPLLPSESQQQQHQPVLYSDVQHLR